MLRMYNPEELRGLTTGLDAYHWFVGTLRGKPIPFTVVYLVGMPIDGAGAHRLNRAVDG